MMSQKNLEQVLQEFGLAFDDQAKLADVKHEALVAILESQGITDVDELVQWLSQSKHLL